ncbi:hypothetical protein EJ06DRAFT_468147 [Trichodelitschia bisporula]|uniref:DUF2470 domain-containing protein n=1 Tax=Trichodelitschia bisporula TaxID=703511 RepID=A0A6G1I9R2_9PEZI|nr:hypothetical protein EJ06DRAFT_468147 [Trichodelitschia bisporula]
MATPEDATKQRIITHMNRDHRASITRYAEHYLHLPAALAATATLTDISPTQLVLQTGDAQTHTIALDPPLKSLTAARERLVAMDGTALTALGRSRITVQEYRAPRGGHLVAFVLCLGTFVLLSRKENVLPGGWGYEALNGVAPRMAAWFEKWGRTLFWTLGGVHAVETVNMARRLKKHNVPMFSGVWVAWVVSCLIEGVGSFQRYVMSEGVGMSANGSRFSALVEEKRKESKH